MKLFDTEPSDSFWIKWENTIFPDEQIPMDEWERNYIHKINPPPRAWDSEEHRAEFMAWAEAKRKETECPKPTSSQPNTDSSDGTQADIGSK